MLAPPSRPSSSSRGGAVAGTRACGTGKSEESKDSMEDEHDHLFDLALDLLCIAHTSGYFRRVNPSFTRVLGWSSEELTSKPGLDFVHPDDRPSSLRALERIGAGETLVEYENRFICKDGTWRLLTWKALSRT